MMIDSFAHARPRFPNAPVLAALLAVLGVPTVAFSAQWLQDDREAPLHPTVIMADYKGKEYPVTAVRAEVPEIMVDGKVKKLGSDQSYRTPRAVGYGAGYVTFKGLRATTTTMTSSVRVTGGMSNGYVVPGGSVSSTGDYECTVVSAEPLADCYLAVVFYREDAAGLPVAGATAIAFSHIGDLAAGRETKVTINRAYVAPPGAKYYFFPMMFSKGLEIRTDQSENASGYFRRGEMAVHEALLARYRQVNPAADRSATVYLRVRPEIPPGINPRSLPAVINAKFAVTETGEVDAVELDQVLDVNVDREIRRALNGWLFLPRLKQGYPVRSMFALPLSFEPGTS